MFSNELWRGLFVSGTFSDFDQLRIFWTKPAVVVTGSLANAGCRRLAFIPLFPLFHLIFPHANSVHAKSSLEPPPPRLLLANEWCQRSLITCVAAFWFVWPAHQLTRSSADGNSWKMPQWIIFSPRTGANEASRRSFLISTYMQPCASVPTSLPFLPPIPSRLSRILRLLLESSRSNELHLSYWFQTNQD